MISELAVWLILLAPVFSFVIIGAVLRPFYNRLSVLSPYITILAVGTSAILAIWALWSVAAHKRAIEFADYPWMKVGDFDFVVGIILDPLTAVMLVVVTIVSLLVQVYSIGYMRGDPGYSRYFAYMSFFTAAMIGLILANNIVLIFVFWELVGLGSYLLIGFWFQRPAAAAAAKKAFIITRFGDFGFLIGILYLFTHSESMVLQGLNPLVITDIYRAIEMDLISTTLATWVGLGIFAGAIGKSAQFPLHTWLPDAMEGPTPVSALIHAATMVAAGIFLVARFFPLFLISDVALNTIAIIGAFTAIFAASMGLVANDIKRVLAYSTVSQLGYMMLALGIGAYGPAIFHLVTHAFFKALLFLGSGSVNHTTGTFDMRYMGGLRKHMPLTYITFLIGGLSLAGIFPFSGFWSKDEIIVHAFGSNGIVNQIIFFLALIAIFMTAFYMFRMLFMTFEGQFKGGGKADPDIASKSEIQLHESPIVMTLPLVILAVITLSIGFLINPIVDIQFIRIHWLSHFLGTGFIDVEASHFNWTLALLSSVIAVAGILLAYLNHKTSVLSSLTKLTLGASIHELLIKKYYFDYIYENIIVIKGFYLGITRFLDWNDRSIVDRIINIIGWLGINIGSSVRQLQTGHLQGYGFAIVLGIILIFGIAYIAK